MLEDQSFHDVVSWGPHGDCFVVKDMNEFTKSILPRMFKHSNFASFVRQLNKYDFHKVRLTFPLFFFPLFFLRAAVHRGIATPRPEPEPTHYFYFYFYLHVPPSHLRRKLPRHPFSPLFIPIPVLVLALLSHHPPILYLLSLLYSVRGCALCVQGGSVPVQSAADRGPIASDVRTYAVPVPRHRDMARLHA